jgi:hypothetical protein
MGPCVNTKSGRAVLSAGHPWWAVWVAVLATATGISMAASAAAAAPTGGTAAAGAGVLTTIAVQKCPSALAVPPTTFPHLPASVKLHIPAQYVGKLSIYGDEIGAKMLAPKGWSCNAQYGADGTGGMTIHPATGSFGPHSEQIDATTTGRCSVCAVGVACDLFKSAAAAFTPVIPGTKCQSRPAGEKVVHLTPNIVAFEIPPHVGGEGTYPDNGVLTYYPVPNSVPLTWRADCLLPQGAHELCAAVLDQFISWDGGPKGPQGKPGHA